VGDQKWTYQQLGGFDGKSLFPLMRRAAGHYQDEKFKSERARIPKIDPSDREHLLTGE
jgi:hypothetical protein